MSNKGNSEPNRRLTKRQLQRHILQAMGQKTPEQQALDFQQKYLANWMRKRGNTIPSKPAPPPSDTSDEG